MKVCKKCSIEKELNEYHKGYSIYKLCRKQMSKDFRNNNLELIKERQKKYYDSNKEYVKDKYLNAYHGIKINKVKKIDPLHKFKGNVRCLIRTSYKKKGYKKNSRTEQILGCSYEDFKTYIESKFDYWMTFDNHGMYNGSLLYGWDIDHIIPLSTAKTEEDIIRLNHYLNLQPLCSYTNRHVKRDNL